MDLIPLTVEKRELSSKGYLRTLRTSGKIPAVLHGRQQYSLPITLDSKELARALSTPAGRNVLLELQLDGEKKPAMVENLQRDILREGVYQHVDLMLVSLDEKIEVSIPVVLVGQESRVNDDGVISQPIYEIVILSTPLAIPENIRVDISSMAIGDSIVLGDLTLPEGCEAVTALDEMLVNILPPRLEEEPETEEDDEAAELPEPELVDAAADDEAPEA